MGIVAYELLTEAKPYRLKRQSATALEDTIASADVRPASAAAFNKIFSQNLRSDLYAIFNKTLKKIFTKHYPSIDTFAQNIERHLANLPVLAQPDRWSYAQ